MAGYKFSILSMPLSIFNHDKGELKFLFVLCDELYCCAPDQVHSVRVDDKTPGILYTHGCPELSFFSQYASVHHDTDNYSSLCRSRKPHFIFFCTLFPGPLAAPHCTIYPNVVESSLLECRKDIRCLPIIRSFGTVNLIDSELGIVDSIDPRLLFNDNARVVVIDSQRSALTFFPRNWHGGIENTVAGVDLFMVSFAWPFRTEEWIAYLESWLIGDNIEPV